MEQYTEPRNKPKPIWSINMKKEARIYNKEESLQKRYWENWKAMYRTIKLSLSYTTHKNKLKTD